jgi:predicted MPP superfamily phosphohydrolase
MSKEENIKEEKGDSFEFQIASDLHIEFFRESNKDLLPIIPSKSKLLCLLGDIGYDDEKYRSYIKEHAERFENVIIITGNHEYYKSEYHTVNKNIEEFASKIKNVHFLQKKSIIIDGIKFLGCTLWSKGIFKILNL